MKVIPETRRAH